MNELFPTPETDACNAIYRAGHLNPYPRLCEDLERRLAVARDALEYARIGIAAVGVRNQSELSVLQEVMSKVTESLTQTAPKP